MTASRIVLAVLLALSTGDFVPTARARRPNAAADALKRLGPAFGADFDPSDRDGRHPSDDELRDSGASGAGRWLNSEIEKPDEEITEPPEALRGYLNERRDPLFEIVAALEKDSPDWGERPGDGLWPIPVLFPTIRLERVLLAQALIEEREGDPAAASRLVEASWSLERFVAARVTRIDQLIAIASEKLQVGALRKMKSVTFGWSGRLTREDPWRRMLDAAAEEAKPERLGEGTLEDPAGEVIRKVNRRIVEELENISPCELARLSEEEIWKRIAEDLTLQNSEAKRSMLQIMHDSFLNSAVAGLRRAGRLSVDRELTLRLVELRIDRAASRPPKWPTTLSNPASGVCPDATYAYASDGESFEIRFEGDADSPDTRPSLPLSFRASKAAVASGSSPTPTPTATPALTPAPIRTP